MSSSRSPFSSGLVSNSVSLVSSPVSLSQSEAETDGNCAVKLKQAAEGGVEALTPPAVHLDKTLISGASKPRVQPLGRRNGIREFK